MENFEQGDTNLLPPAEGEEVENKVEEQPQPIGCKHKIIKHGFLKKRSKILHLWKTRFFILNEKYLFAFTGVEKDADCTMVMLLENCTDIRVCDSEIKKENSFCIRFNGTNYFFRARSEEDRSDWIEKIAKYCGKKSS